MSNVDNLNVQVDHWQCRPGLRTLPEFDIIKQPITTSNGAFYTSIRPSRCATMNTQIRRRWLEDQSKKFAKVLKWTSGRLPVTRRAVRRSMILPGVRIPLVKSLVDWKLSTTYKNCRPTFTITFEWRITTVPGSTRRTHFHEYNWLKFDGRSSSDNLQVEVTVCWEVLEGTLEVLDSCRPHFTVWESWF